MFSLIILKYLVWMSCYNRSAAAMFISCMGSLSPQGVLTSRQQPTRYAVIARMLQNLIIIIQSYDNRPFSQPSSSDRETVIIVYIFALYFLKDLLIILLKSLRKKVMKNVYDLRIYLFNTIFQILLFLKVTLIISNNFIMGPLSSKTQGGQIKFQQVKENIIQKLTKAFEQKLKAQNIDVKKYIQDPINDRRIGCLFGCLIGDALGAYCEFQTKVIQEKVLEQAMNMSGGGVFDLFPGQFTDDTEMAFHLMRALLTFDPKFKLEQQYDKLLKQIAKQYVNWEKTSPFDIGITCRKGIQVLASFNLQNNLDVKIDDILNKVKTINANSQSNGSLMRIAPMAIFFSSIKEDPINHEQFIKNEIALIHSNQILQEAGFVWVKMLYQLILRPNSEQNTYKKIWQKVNQTIKNAQIKRWLQQVKQGITMQATENMGWAKIAWTYGMEILSKLANGYQWQNKYKDKIRQIIVKGGDSDTNAAIVGGLLGAVFSLKGLPANYLDTVFKLQFPQIKIEHRDRPKYFQATNLLFVLLELIKNGEEYERKNLKDVRQPTSNL